MNVKLFLWFEKVCLDLNQSLVHLYSHILAYWTLERLRSNIKRFSGLIMRGVVFQMICFTQIR